MEKKWKILPKAKNQDSRTAGYPDIILDILYHRGIKTAEAIDAFMDPDYEKQAQDPFLFSAMESAVDAIIGHIKSGNKIFVYGDYDADGITATALLFETLKILKANVDPYIPFRVEEGYGLNEAAIDHIAGHKAKLIITVDTGIRNKKQVEYAQSMDIEVIVTDHHSPPPQKEDYPDCLIIDPHTAGEKYPDKSLAGCGVALKLAAALISKAKISAEQKNTLEERLLDLAAIGTVADVVSLLGENRKIVRKGLEVLNSTKRIGLKELITSAQLNSAKKIDSWNIGFQIAPRINAAGRLEHANTSFQLLVTKDREEAARLARSLNANNVERQRITEEIFQEIEQSLAGKPVKEIIIAVSPSFSKNAKWNEGVIGLVASKISSKYHRPAIVITSGEDFLKGSGRSIEEFNIIKAVEECGELLLKYGGHPAACGIQIEEKKLPAFISKIEQIAHKQLAGAELVAEIKIDSEIGLNEINAELVGLIERLAPFGTDNERPKFVSRNLTVVDSMTMGVDNQHVKFRVKAEDSLLFSAVAFSKALDYAHISAGDKVDMVYYLEINEFNGRSEIQLKVVDIRSHNA